MKIGTRSWRFYSLIAAPIVGLLALVEENLRGEFWLRLDIPEIGPKDYDIQFMIEGLVNWVILTMITFPFVFLACAIFDLIRRQVRSSG